MYNNAIFGFMIQRSICKKFKITLTNEKTINAFNSNYDESLKKYIDRIVDDIFSKLDFEPIECTTFNVDQNKKEIPYNFILSDNSTLSIRTNINGSKISPRVVGQAGFETLNFYFSDIYGKEIETQDDIKHLMIDKIDEVFPIFVDKLFDADYILWIFQDKNDKTKFSYQLFKGDSLVEIDYSKKNFSFTRDYESWNESTTLKYRGTSLAEIQVHKHRSFKFRFIMDNLNKLIKEFNENNETLGITVEKTICDIYKLEYPENLKTRYSRKLESELKDFTRLAFEEIPKPIKYTGSEKGLTGNKSKCPYDFILIGEKTLSVKTNKRTDRKMVCPPEIGQPNDLTCYYHFGDLIEESKIDKLIFKKMVFENVDKMIPRYLKYLFDSDYLLWIYENNNYVSKFDEKYKFNVIEKYYGENVIWDKNEFSFSKKTINEWNESNTVYYRDIPLGEFQIHNNRNCFKFRFNIKNLIRLIDSEYIDIDY